MIRRKRYRAAYAGAVAAAAVLATAVPAAAATSSGSIVVDSVTSPADETGLLSVQAEATTAITSLTVHIYSGTTEELTLPYADFSQTSGSPTDGIWTVTSPVSQTELGLGTYQVTVDATDAGGDAVTGVSMPDAFFFGLDPTVTLATTSTTLNYFRQSVTFSGQVTADYPDGTVQPVADQQVSISGEDGGSWTATTDINGDYALIVTPDLADSPDMAESFAAAVSSSPATEAASSADLELTGQVDPVQVTAALSTATAAFGAPVTFSGTALYESGGVWLPFADSAIDITGTDYYTGLAVPAVTAKTDDSGSFTVQLPAQPSTTWSANPPASQYLTPSYAALSGLPNTAMLTVVLPTELESVQVAYNPAGKVISSGCLDLSPAVSSFPDLTPPADADLSLEYSRSARGPWRTLGALNAGGVPSCHSGTGFRGTRTPAALSGYYRVDFAGQLLYEPAAGAVVHAATAPTRFADFRITPGAVSGHGRITASGKLEDKAPGWRSLGSAPVTLYVEPAGGSTWYWYKKLRVSRSGSFSIRFADPVSGHWAVGYAGNSTHLASMSRIAYASASGTGANALPELGARALSGRAERALLAAR